MSRSWAVGLLLLLAVAAVVWAARAALELSPTDPVSVRAGAESPAPAEEVLPTRKARGPELRGVGGATFVPAFGRIRGEVVGADGRPAAGVRVCATSDVTTAHAPVCTTTDAEGRFDLGPLRRGMHRVVARTAGTSRLEAAEWVWTDAARERLELAPAIQRLLVQVLDASGARIPRFLAYVTDGILSEGYAGEIALGLGSTDEAWFKTHARTLHVWGAADDRVQGLDLGSVTVSLDEVSEEPMVVVLPVLPAVDVEVVDDSGRPVANALVRLEERTGEGWPDRSVARGPHRIAQGITDRHGRSRVARVDASTAHRLEVEPPSALWTWQLRDVPAEQTSVRVVLPTLTPVTVRVEGEDGGAAGVPVEVWLLDPSSALPVPGAPKHYLTDSRGDAVLNLPMGQPHRVRLGGDWDSTECAYAPRTVDAWLPAPTTWKLAVAQPLDVGVFEDDGRVYEGATVEIFQGALQVTSGRVTSAEQRRVRVRRPPEGTLRIVASDDARSVRREILVAEHEREGVSIVLPTGEGCEVEIALDEDVDTSLMGVVGRAHACVACDGAWCDVFRVLPLPPASGTLRWRLTSTHWPVRTTFLCWIPDLGHARVDVQRGARVRARLEPGERLILRAPLGAWVDDEDVHMILHRPDEPAWGELQARAVSQDGRVSLGGLPPGEWNVMLGRGWGDVEGEQLSIQRFPARTGVVTDVPQRPPPDESEDR